MSILWPIPIGLVAGAIAKLVMPGRDPGGLIVTVLIRRPGFAPNAFRDHWPGEVPEDLPIGTR